VVEGAAGHDPDEGARLVELLEAHLTEERTLGRVGIDRRDRVAGGREACGQLAPAATDLEDASPGWKLLEDEALEVQGFDNLARSLYAIRRAYRVAG
jgi:hypothetical protein